LAALALAALALAALALAALTLALPLALALALALTLALTLALALLTLALLTLALLTLALLALALLALALTLALTLLALPLLALALLALALLALALLPLALLALALLAGLRQIPPGLLQVPRRSRQVAIDVHLLLATLEGLAKPVESVPRGGRIALAQRARGVAQRRLRVGACLACRRLELRQLLRQCLALGVGHRADLVLELLEILLGLLRVAGRVAVTAGGGAADRA
jgi:hypothetical protein